MNSGRLGTAGIAHLLREYATGGATGCLRLDRDDMQARVYFRDGLVYAATAPSARARLGDRLVGAGHITEDELASTLEHQRGLPEPRRIGELLIERGLIDRETMRTFVREQSTDSVAVTLGWQDGEWTFTPGEEVPEDVPLDMSVENLVMEGARRLEQWEVIQARIGSVDAVPDFVPRDDTAELALTPDEWSMLTRIDGRSTIAEIAEEAGYSEFDAGRIIYGLFTAGIVSLLDDAGDEQAEPLAEAPTDAWEQPEPLAEAPTDAWEQAVEEGAGADDERAGAEPLAEPPWPEEPTEQEPADEPAAYTPGEASQLFGELGLGEPARDEREPDEPPPPPEPPAPAPPPAEAEQERTGEPVNRNELLREFAALDTPDSDESDDAPSRPAAPRPPRRDEDSDRDKRKGLFGRRRRD